MARRRKRNDYVQSYDYSKRDPNGSVGLSEATLKALNERTYGKFNTRKPTYTRSEDQIKIVSPSRIPALDGMRPVSTTKVKQGEAKKTETKKVETPKTETRTEKRNYVNTDRARQSYSEKYNQKPLETPTTFLEEPKKEEKEYTDKVKKLLASGMKNPLANMGKMENPLGKIAKEKQAEKKVVTGQKPSNFDTQKARQKASNEHTAIGRTLSKEDADYLYSLFDSMRLQPDYNRYQIIDSIKNNRNLKKDTSDWEEKYGRSIEDIVNNYDFETESAIREKEKGDKHGVLSTLQTVLNGAVTEPALDLITTVAGKVAPNTEVADIYKNASRQNKTQKAQIREGVTSDMSDLGKGAYNTATGVGERVLRYLNPSPLKYLLTLGQSAENTRESLEDRGITGTSAEYQSLLSGAVDAGLDYYGLERVPALQGLRGSTNIGRRILGNTIVGGGEMAITNLVNQVVDSIANGENSNFERNVAYYTSQGDSDNVAYSKALWDSVKELAYSTGQGALLANAMGEGGRAVRGAADVITGRNIPEVWTPTKAEEPIPTVDEIAALIKPRTDVVDNALAETERAVETIDHLARQIPPVENTEVEIPDLAKLQQEARARAEAQAVAKAQEAIPEEAPIETPIREALKDSKVVDDNGNPMVMYHGTNADFEGFDTGKSSDKSSIFFTNNPDVANSYTGNDTIHKAYLNVKNPLVIDANGRSGADIEWTPEENGRMEQLLRTINEFERRESNGERITNAEVEAYEKAQAEYNDLENKINSYGDISNTDGIAAYAKDHGYDGVIIQNVLDVGPKTDEAVPSTVAIVNDPKNIIDIDANKAATPTAKPAETPIEGTPEIPSVKDNRTMNESFEWRNPRLVEKLEGEELTNAQNTIKENKATIAQKKADIDNLKQIIQATEENRSNYRGKNLKKDVKEYIAGKQNEIAAIEKEIAEITETNKGLKKQVKGYEYPVKAWLKQTDEDLYNDIYNPNARIGSFAQDLNYLAKFAGDTPEAKALAKEIRADLDTFLKTETFDMDETRRVYRNVSEKLASLDQMAQDTRAAYKTSKADWTYDDFFGDEIGYKNIQDDFLRVISKINDFQKTLTPPEAPQVNEVPSVKAETPVEPPVSEPISEVNEVPSYKPAETNNVQPTNNEVPSYKPEQASNNIPPEEPIMLNPPRTDEIGESEVGNNTAVNAGVYTKEQLDNDPVISEMNKYAKASNDLTFTQAKTDVINEGAKLLDEYSTGKRAITDDIDVDRSMILLTDLSRRINAGEEGLDAQRNLLFSRLRQAGTKGGQLIQAFAKWNNTPEGAMINSQKIVDDRVDAWESTNQTKVEANNQLADAIEKIDNVDISNEGSYRPPRTPNEAEQTSRRLDQALRRQGYDNSMESEPAAPKTHEQHRVEVENSIKRELGSVSEQLNDNDYEVLTNYVENKVPVDIIADEIEHRLNHGEWYTIDESTPVKKATSQKLSKILKDMGDDRLKSKNQPIDNGYPKKSHATISDEVVNTLEKEAAGLGLDTETDVEFITTMLEEGVPSWKIEDEINHRLMTGEWYTLDESIEQPKPIDAGLRNILDSLVNTEEAPAKQELSFDEIRERIKNTLEGEPASDGTGRLYTEYGDFTDNDIDYLARLKQNGATKEELAHALNTKLATGTFGISPETEQLVVDNFKYAEQVGMNSREGVNAILEAYRALANETVGDADAYERFEAWRYLAMLGNPKTMIRNAVGNVSFGTVTGVSNTLAAAIEGGIDRAMRAAGSEGIKRQKAVLNPATDANLIRQCFNDAELNRWSEVNSTKFESSPKDAIKAQRPVFRSRLLQLYDRATKAGVSDRLFVQSKYSTSLAGYLKANGLDASALDAETVYNRLNNLSQTRLLTDAERLELNRAKQTMDIVERGRDYAIKQAEYATFHEDNAVAQWMNKTIRSARNSDSRVLRAVGTIGEGLFPFKNTPANIVRSGYDFSPLRLIQNIAETGKLIYENTGRRKADLAETYTNRRGREVQRSLASDVIDDWSKTMTGSMLLGLGYYLTSKGILKSGAEDDKYQDQLEGRQAYSIEINGKSYSIDWAAPGVIPLLIGAEIKNINDANAVSDEKWYKNIDQIVSSFNTIIDPILETSYMQGIQNALQSASNQIQYNNSDGGNSSAIGGIAGAFGANALTSYATQAIPTLFGQIARTVDPTRRATDTATESNFLSEFEKTARKTANKIPFLSRFVNEPYYDAYGRTQNNSPTENPLLSLAYQMLSPAYINNINETDADKSARAAYEGLVPTVNENGEEVMKPVHDNKAFASWKNSVKINGQKLDPQQMAQYRQETGEANYAIRDALAKEDWFNDLSPDKQTDILGSVNTLVDKIGKEKYTSVSGKDYEAYKKGGVPSLLDYYKGQNVKTEVTEQTGLSASSNASKAIVEQAQKGNTEVANQMISDAKAISDAGLTKPGPTATFQAAQKVDPNLNVNDFITTYKAIDTDGNQGIKKAEIMDYLNKNKIGQQQGLLLWNMYKPANAKKVPELVNGTWK